MAIAESNAHVVEQESQLVTFNLGTEEFGFDIMSVQEIIRQPVVSRIPMAPDYVEGVANLRGTILPIIDTRTRFGMKREQDTDTTRVLVIDVDGVKTGLRVDCVKRVTRILSTDMEAPPAVIRAKMSSQYLNGVVKLDGGKRIIMSLSPAEIVRMELGTAVLAPQESATGGEHAAAAVVQAAAAVAQFVSFKLGEEEFAFPMDRVREILRVQRVSKVPDTPPHFLGMLTVRGAILPVIDLRTLLGLRPMAEEVRCAAARVRAEFERWLGALQSHAKDGSSPHPGDAAVESLRTFVAAFTTSSQVLMETLGSIRIANENVVRGYQKLRGAKQAQSHFEADIRPSAHVVIQKLTALEEQIAENISEDQRLVVVQTGATLLALLVDKVRAVLSVPVGLIDAPPHTGAADAGAEIKGVARLEDGKRLIMLLDADHLVDVEALNTSTGAEAGTMKNDVSPSGPTSSSKSTGDSSGSGSTRQFVTFRLDDGEYGIPISEVQEIDRYSTMTRIPKSASYVEGVTNLRGQVIPVVNARTRFNLETRGADERTRVIIVDIGGTKTGLVVDSVREVLNLNQSDIALPPAAISSGIDQSYISGIGKIDGGKRMIVLLNVAKVVTTDDE